ncbi:methionine--tRNA ligase, cytoplasmic, partial [Trichonephila clavata]
MSILYSDLLVCNLGSLKVLATAQYYSSNIEIAQKKDEVCKEDPVLITSDGSLYFSSNASCRYIYSLNKDVSFLTDSWLEWESTILEPSISGFLKATKGDAASLSLKNSLNYLNALLSQQNYLCSKESLDLPDIVIWADLYPLFKASMLPEVSELPHLQKWLSSLNNQNSLSKAFLTLSKGVKSENLKKNISCTSVLPEQSKFFMPIHVPDFSIHTQPNANNQESFKEVNITADEIAAAYTHWLKGKDSFPSPNTSKGPVLPKKGEKNVLITSALPYVNNIPHLGNIIGSVLSADVFARYCRARGYNTLYICGTDEYGTATETKAIAMKVTPKEICDKYHKLHSEIYEWFNISFDYFGRTSTAKQTEIAQNIFLKLYTQDLVFVDSVEQLFCASCERFLADRFVEGICPLCQYEDARGDQCDKCGKLINAAELKQPQCKLCRATPHLKSSKHLFLNLPKLEESVKKHLDKVTSTGHWSNTAKVIANSWLREGLKPRCITRDLKWGIPVPLEGFTDKVFYVWFDAPIGYLSITANYTDKWEQWWKQPDIVQLYQFMAKDNVPFHSIIFPACLIGSKDKYTVVNHLAATVSGKLFVEQLLRLRLLVSLNESLWGPQVLAARSLSPRGLPGRSRPGFPRVIRVHCSQHSRTLPIHLAASFIPDRPSQLASVSVSSTLPGMFRLPKSSNNRR